VSTLWTDSIYMIHRNIDVLAREVAKFKVE
jgi:hypothetical protein